MDLLFIPVLLLIGGTLIYIGANGMPDLTLSALPMRRNREPFQLTDWMHARPEKTVRSRAGKLSSSDAELVELMNEMIAVREDLTALKQRMAGKAPRRREAVAQEEVENTKALASVEPPEEAPVVEKPVTRAPAATASKLPHPVKAPSELPPQPVTQQPLLARTVEHREAEKPAPIAASQESKPEKPEAPRPAYKESRDKPSQRDTGHTRRYARI